jgi:hypothetical protein
MTDSFRLRINSVALRFVPNEDLDAQGYGQYKRLFDSADDDKEVTQ